MDVTVRGEGDPVRCVRLRGGQDHHRGDGERENEDEAQSHLMILSETRERRSIFQPNG